MATLFNTQPRPGESNIHYGLRALPQSIANSVLSPFAPGGRLNLFGGAWNPSVPGSITNQGLGVVGQLFGLNGPEGVQKELDKSMAYALAPATGPVAPPTPPGKPNFNKPSEQSNLPANARGVRNNNYLNLTMSPFTRSQPGFAGTDAGGRYARFETPEAGQAAAEKLLGSYIKRGFDTPAEIIGRWAPASENGQASTGNYARYVASGLGIGLNDKVTPQQIPFLAKRMAEFENGVRSGPNLQAFQGAADAAGLSAPPPGFNQSGYDQADQFFQEAQRSAMQPFSAVMQTTPMPELPKPQELQTPDYSASDQAFAAAQPKNPFGATPEEAERGKLRMRRMDYFAGMAQALGSIDWSRGVGLGELFAKLGAGALSGAKYGDAEVQDKMERFDAAMQQYSLALANRDDTRAREATNIANQNIQSLNQYKRDQWQVQVSEWQKNEPRVENGVLITRTPGPDGQVIETHTPLDKSREAAALMARANNAIARMNSMNEYSWQTWRANRELAGAALPYAMADAAGQGNLQGRDAIATLGLSEAAIAATETGRWSELYTRYIGAGRVAQVQEEANRVAHYDPNLGKAPTEAQTKAMNDYISSQVITDFVNSGKSWALTGGETENRETGERKYNPPSSTVAASVATQREKDRKVRRTTDYRGRTTTSESY